MPAIRLWPWMCLRNVGLLTLTAIVIYVIWGPSGKRRRRTKRGSPRGLVNHGTTCFVNAVLQFLASSSKFGAFLQDSVQMHTRPDNDSEAAPELMLALLRIIRSTNGQGRADPLTAADENVDSAAQVLVALKYGVNAIHSSWRLEAMGTVCDLIRVFSFFLYGRNHCWRFDAGQQDAHEMFQVLISTLEEELRRWRGTREASRALAEPPGDTRRPSDSPPGVIVKCLADRQTTEPQSVAGSMLESLTPFSGTFNNRVLFGAKTVNSHITSNGFTNITLTLPRQSLMRQIGSTSLGRICCLCPCFSSRSTRDLLDFMFSDSQLFYSFPNSPSFTWSA